MMDDAGQGRRERPYQTDMGATEDEASRRPAPPIDMAVHSERSSYPSVEMKTLLTSE